MLRGALLALPLLTLATLLAATPASAELTGGCTASIAGEDPEDLSSTDPSDAISIPKGTSVPWRFNAPTEITAWDVILHYGPASTSVVEGEGPADDPEPGTTQANTAAVDQYAWMGVGLYELTGTITTEGGQTCSGTVLVDVEGNPLKTVAGGTATILTAAGATGLAAAGVSGFKAATAAAGAP